MDEQLIGTVAARPISEWHEDDGPVLWWFFPIQEAPYVGTPLDETWAEHELDGIYTHWTPIPIPPRPWPTDSAGVNDAPKA